MCLYVCMQVCMWEEGLYMSYSAQEVQKRALGSPGLELQEVVNHPVWLLGTKLRS